MPGEVPARGAGFDGPWIRGTAGNRTRSGGTAGLVEGDDVVFRGVEQAASKARGRRRVRVFMMD